MKRTKTRLETFVQFVKTYAAVFSVNVVTLLPKITFLRKDKNTDTMCRVYDDAVDRFFTLRNVPFVAELYQQQCMVSELGHRDAFRTCSGPFFCEVDRVTKVCEC